MPLARVFVPLQALETWLAEGRAEVDADVLTLDGQSFQMASAVRFLAEVAGGPDEQSLIGRVKSIAQLTALGAEHARDSVLLGDNAYFVIEGYTLSPQSAATTLPYPRLIQLFART